MDYCKIILHGRLTQDPEIRYTPTGAAVASFSVAINRKYRKGEEGKLEEAVTFVPVRSFGKAAEQAGEHLAKGRAVLVDGELRSSEWKGEGGETRRRLYVAAQKIIYLGKANGKPVDQEKTGGAADSDDIPF
ncbi:single-stranded DNA-binding protein [Candidatus Manganitrophus noduliformans]|uniref:Single-stranded DNA-binding protein n=1 Tax=Candidatus Manganitrophus noduliformans TaxID=2606439 RepID=A0A7X6ICS6_9BACT|nr:single-stranded DNA-binding protein [Candidatus Manganitrophus noduliformans]NKE72861.1 single-stranded DNA-binding protein [Candidatus Manganitrophus noduliformans]